MASHFLLPGQISGVTKAVRRCFASAASNIKVKPISGSLGAEISGLDVRQMKAAESETIQKAWLKHKVLFFRDQHLEPKDFLTFSAEFGTPAPYPFVEGIDGYSQIIEVLKQEDEKSNFGGIWHSDTVYLEEPPKATILIARELPPQGGDTLFANQVAAYEGLSSGLQKMLDKLTAVHTSAKADVSKTREDRVKGSNMKQEDLVSYHPVVRTHPETGEKSLYINTAHTERFEGWSSEESTPLLQYLHQCQIKPEYTCRFQWQVGSIALWDNRSVLHNPINDYHGFKRSMHRITLAGDKPR